MNHSIKTLSQSYKKRKHKIKDRLKEFSALGQSSENDIFAELCFCILTPQSRAVYCDEAVRELKSSGLFLKGSARQMRKVLGRVRFPNNKALYLVEARKAFMHDRGLNIKGKIDCNDNIKTRDWFVKNIKGLGYKEASHFLRNIGLGYNLAILDVHILRNLVRLKVIKTLPKTLSRKHYLSIEEKLKGFSRKVKIPMEELDLLFWSNETGFIFK